MSVADITPEPAALGRAIATGTVDVDLRTLAALLAAATAAPEPAPLPFVELWALLVAADRTLVAEVFSIVSDWSSDGALVVDLAEIITNQPEGVIS